MMGRYVVGRDVFGKMSLLENVGEVKVRIKRGELKSKVREHELSAYILVPPQAIKCHRVDEAGARTIARGSFLKAFKLLQGDRDVAMNFEGNVVVFEIGNAKYTAPMYADEEELFESFDPPVIPKHPAKVALGILENAVDIVRRVDSYVKLTLDEDKLVFSSKNEVVSVSYRAPAEYDGEVDEIRLSGKALQLALKCFVDGIISAKVDGNVLELSQSDELGVETVVRLRGVDQLFFE